MCLLYGHMFAFNTFAVSVIISLAMLYLLYVVVVFALVFRKLNNICGKQVCLVYVLKAKVTVALDALQFFV